MRKGIWFAAAVVALLPGALLALRAPPALAAEKTRVAIVDVDTPATKWHYEPNEVTVGAGSTVVWRNDGNQPHTVTSDKTADNRSFNSSYLTHGQEWEWTFSTPGEYSYYCEPHNWMRGVLHVTAASSPSPTAPPATQPTPVTTPTTSTASTPKPTAAPATTTTGAAATTTKASSAALAPTTTAAPAAPVPTTTPAPAGAAPADTAAVPATTSPPTIQEEAAAPPGGHSGRGNGNPVAIALGSMATLGVTAIAGRLLLSKPR
jgi:plastocyanin